LYSRQSLRLPPISGANSTYSADLYTDQYSFKNPRILSILSWSKTPQVLLLLGDWLRSRRQKRDCDTFAFSSNSINQVFKEKRSKVLSRSRQVWMLRQ
jgi:hypothetical protein